MDFLLDVLADSGQLFLKPSPASRQRMHTPDERAPFPGARMHLRVTADLWDDRLWLNQLVRTVYDNLPPVKPAKPRKPRKSHKPA